MRLRFGSLAANGWGRAFLKQCRRTMAPLVDDIRSLESDIKGEAQTLFNDGAASLPDKQGRTILGMCSLVLAAYRKLNDRLDDPKAAFDTVRSAFRLTYAAPMNWYIRLWLWMYQDPVGNRLSNSLVKIGQRLYGKSMEFAEEQSADSAEMLVTRCAYHQFFVEHDAPSLTPLICAWDRNWMDLIDGSTRPVRTERPSTISTGGDCCRFRFVRDHEKSGKAANDIVLVQLGVAPLKAEK